MQALLGARMRRMFRGTPALWILAALVAVPSLVMLATQGGSVSANLLSTGYLFLPLGAALLCVAYDAGGLEACEAHNCLPCGRSRLEAYLSSLGALAAGCLVLFCACYLPLLAQGALYGWLDEAPQVLGVLAGALCSMLALLCAYHAICAACHRPFLMLLAILVFLGFFLLASANVRDTLAEPEYAPKYEYNDETGFATYLGIQPNPYYPPEEVRAALAFWARALPTMLMLSVGAPDAGFFLGFAADAALAVLLGFLAFRRRNLA